MAEGVAFAHARGAKVLVAINTFPRAGAEPLWHRALANAEAAGADAVILADIGLLAHAADRHPALRRHLSVQAAAANPDAINLYASAFGVRRVVLPRVLTVEEIAAINREIEVETEVFVFGGLCVMAEGRCSLSSYATGQSPNMNGVCSPASHVAYAEEGRRPGRAAGRLHHPPHAQIRRPRPTPRCARAASPRARRPGISSKTRCRWTPPT
jgi:collagenase-like PrtC family protease